MVGGRQRFSARVKVMNAWRDPNSKLICTGGALGGAFGGALKMRWSVYLCLGLFAFPLLQEKSIPGFTISWCPGFPTVIPRTVPMRAMEP